MTEQEEILRMARDGIQSYLVSGGLFNPEAMNHDKVRELIMLCRDALDLVAAHSFNDGWIKGNKGLMEAVREEREACAMVCDEIAVEADAMTKSKFVTNTGRMLEEGKWGGSTDCAAAIRARGEK